MKNKLSSKKDKLSNLESGNTPMFYLVIKTMNFQRCIDKNSKDIYKTPGSYNCIRSQAYNSTNIVRKIMIRCIENPSEEIEATVYSD